MTTERRPLLRDTDTCAHDGQRAFVDGETWETSYVLCLLCGEHEAIR